MHTVRLAVGQPGPPHLLDKRVVPWVDAGPDQSVGGRRPDRDSKHGVQLVGPGEPARSALPDPGGDGRSSQPVGGLPDKDLRADAQHQLGPAVGDDVPLHPAPRPSWPSTRIWAPPPQPVAIIRRGPRRGGAGRRTNRVQIRGTRQCPARSSRSSPSTAGSRPGRRVEARDGPQLRPVLSGRLAGRRPARAVDQRRCAAREVGPRFGAGVGMLARPDHGRPPLLDRGFGKGWSRRPVGRGEPHIASGTDDGASAGGGLGKAELDICPLGQCVRPASWRRAAHRAGRARARRSIPTRPTPGSAGAIGAGRDQRDETERDGEHGARQ